LSIQEAHENIITDSFMKEKIYLKST